MESTPRRPRAWRAPAKVNLTLHVLGRRADGWHDLDSLVAFAGCGDWLLFEPGPALALSVDGPTAAAAGAIGDNLILLAARALHDRAPGLRLGRFHLRKTLPVAAGLGGGSADAAAALRALAEENGLALDDPRVLAAARATGSDVPVCLDPRARMMRGLGETLGPALRLPVLFAVLVNPGVAVATPSVFARLGLAKGAPSGLGASPTPPAGADRATTLALLKDGRNDMQAGACALAPAIAETLAALTALGGAAVVRMSGSGATCFALFEDCRAAARAGRAVRLAHPGWWVKATALR
ncbi:MAG: 4-(cytidine 5'-diphospho)-2-C-methyl-D-erythritol kinase [Roseiarcus sp.]